MDRCLSQEVFRDGRKSLAVSLAAPVHMGMLQIAVMADSSAWFVSFVILRKPAEVVVTAAGNCYDS